MTEDLESKNLLQNRLTKKTKLSSKSLLFVLLMVVLTVSILYYSLTVHNIKQSSLRKIEIENALNDYKRNNIETAIFDLKEEKNKPKVSSENQSEIEEIKAKLSKIENKILQYNHNSRMLILYLEIRENFFLSKNNEDLLRDFKQTVESDDFLSQKVSNLEELLSTNLKPSSITKDLNAAIPDLIAAKNILITQDLNWIEDFKHRLRKLITVRKIHQQSEDSDSFDINFMISKLENNIKAQNYQAASNVIDKIPEKYQRFLTRLKIHMEVLIQIQETDQEIINHLLKTNQS